MPNLSNKRAKLRRMKRMATALLCFFTVLFIITSIYEQQYAWVGFVRAMSEAAMIGAIADWFAVTALFRYPLGLKIPHTAIIPTRKDSIARDFARFVQTNFLSGGVVIDKLRSMDVARNVARWLSQPENSQAVANYLAVGVVALVQVIKDEDIQDIIEGNVAERIHATHFAPIVGNVLALVLSGERRHKLLQGTVKFGAHFLEENREAIKQRISEETPWWLPKNVDNMIYQKIVDAMGRTLNEVSQDPNHPLHDSFDTMISNVIEDLKNSPEVTAKESSLKEDLLADPAVQEFSASLWRDIKQSMVERSTNPETYTLTPIQQGMVRLSGAILDDPAMQAKINHWVEEGASYLIAAYGHEVEQLIAQTISRWDAEEASRKFEDHVGRDLQFIRINGTLVGGMVGLVIHTLSVLLIG